MPSRSPTSSFERPSAINSTTSRCRSVIFSSRSFSTCAMSSKLTTARPPVHWPKGVFEPNTPAPIHGELDRTDDFFRGPVQAIATLALIHGASDVGSYWHLVEAELR